MSPGLWVAFIWLAIISSRPVGYWLSDGTAAASSDVSEGSFIDRNTYLFLIILASIVLFKRRIDWRQVLFEGRWLFILYAYFLLSVFWSDFPFVSFKRWFKETGNLLMICIILTDKNPWQAIRGVFLRCAYVLIPVSVLFIKYYPALGRYYSPWNWEQLYNGVATTKNALGLAGLISGLFLIWDLVGAYEKHGKWELFRRKWPELLLLGMTLWILNIAESSTALACFLLGGVTYFAVRTRWLKSHLPLLYAGGAGVVVILFCFTVFPEFRAFIAALFDRDVTLTNRTVIWEVVLQFGTSPIFGSGFASAWLYPHRILEEEGMVTLMHSHNGYLETYLHSGWIGVLLLVPVLFETARNAVNNLTSGASTGPLFVAFFVAGLFYNYTEVAFNNSNICGFAMWLVASLGMVAQAAARSVPVGPPSAWDPMLAASADCT